MSTFSNLANMVEGVVASRTAFTGEPPYVGDDGVVLALVEALDERDNLRNKIKALAKWKCESCGCRFDTPVAANMPQDFLEGVKRCSRCVEVEILAERIKATFLPITQLHRVLGMVEGLRNGLLMESDHDDHAALDEKRAAFLDKIKVSLSKTIEDIKECVGFPSEERQKTTGA